MLKKHGRVWSLALAGALTVSNLSMVATPLTAYAADTETRNMVNGDKAKFEIGSYGSGYMADYDDAITIDNVENAVPEAATVIKDYEPTPGFDFKWNNGTADVAPGAKYSTVMATKSGEEYIATLTAKEVGKAITVKTSTKGLDGGTPGDVEVTDANEKKYKDVIENAISDPTKKYYTFKGWDLDGDATPEIAPGADAATQSKAIDDNFAAETAESSGDAYNHTVDFTALWTAKTYTVSFDTDDYDTGSLPEKMTTDATKIGTDAVPTVGVTREGYTARGWLLEGSTAPDNKIAEGATLDSIFDPDGTPEKKAAEQTGKATLKVNWVENQFTVTLGKTSVTTAIEASSSWKTGENTVYKEANLSESIVLPTVVSDRVNTKANEIKYATNSKVEFAGWSKKTTPTAADIDYAPGATLTYAKVGSAITLYPVFTSSVEYGIEFAGNGAEGEMDSIDGILNGKKIVLPRNTFEKAHNSFDGWSDGSHEFADGAEITVNSENVYFDEDNIATFTAQWTEDQYTVIFVNEGQTKEKKKVNYSEIVTTPEVSSTGKILLGWDTNSSVTEPKYPVTAGGTTTLSGLTEESTITLYAIYVEESSKVTLTYDRNATAQPKATTAGDAKKVFASKNTNVTLINASATGFTVNSGYVLGGWTLETAEGSGKGYASYEAAVAAKAILPDSYKITGDTTVYAVWKERTLTVKFDGNGGTGSMADMNVKYDPDTGKYNLGKLNENAFTFAGHKFKSWNDVENGNGNSYADKANVDDLQTDHMTDAETVTLYAQWDEFEYRIKFNANGGSGSLADMVGTISVLGPILRSNNGIYTEDENLMFGGWSLNAKDVEPQFEDGADLQDVFDAANADDGETIVLYAIFVKTDLANAEEEADAAKADAANQKAAADKANQDAATAKADADAAKAELAKVPKAETNVNAESGEKVDTKVDGTAVIKEVPATAIKNGKYEVPEKITVNGKEYTVTKIEDNTFRKNKSIKQITVKANITEIGKNAFNGASKLKKVTIKGKDVIIRKNAFKKINKKAKIFVADKDTKKNVEAKGGQPKSVKVKVKK